MCTIRESKILKGLKLDGHDQNSKLNLSVSGSNPYRDKIFCHKIAYFSYCVLMLYLEVLRLVL